MITTGNSLYGAVVFTSPVTPHLGFTCDRSLCPFMAAFSTFVKCKCCLWCALSV